MHQSLLRTAVTAALFAGAAVAVAADPSVVWRTDYPSARKEAEEKNLPLLVVVGTDQCVYCRKLEATTFADKPTLALLANKAVLLKLDANKEAEFARAMRVTIYPTTILAGKDGKVYAYLSGYVGPEAFREHVGKAFALIASAEPEKPKPIPTATLTSRTDTTDKPALHDDNPASRLALAQAAFNGEKYAECLEHVQAALASQPTGPVSEVAKELQTKITADPEKLQRAGEQLDEQVAAAYFSLARGWEEQGKMKDAMKQYEKVIHLSPRSTYAELARQRTVELARTRFGDR